MDEIVKDFLIESSENVDRLDQELVQLESDPQSAELMASIFRTIHTIKGSCGFLGFGRLEKVTHAGESLLSRLRDGKLSLTAEVTSGLLAMVDAVRHMLSQIQATEHDGENDYPELRQQLKRLQEPDVGGQPSLLEPKSSALADPGPVPTAGPAENTVLLEGGKPRILEAEPAAPPPAQTANFPPPLRPKVSSENPKAVISTGGAEPDDLAHSQPTIESHHPEAAVETVRVGINLLDKLMNLVGELVLARNQLLQFSNSTQDAGFHAVSQRMNLIATELQEDVMKTRMQPIGNIWNKFPRTVRDMARNCGKQVRLEMEGQDTELDRTIIEAIKDPLTHLVRNSIDHGIEVPEVRKLAGKEAVGVLQLRAFHEGGQVNIEIWDDGAGLNGERIRQKAIERGLVSAQQAARMPDRDIFNLIFLPGFSTAEKVTNVSGRGVGMDVVKTNVEKIGGAVDIQSSPGRGTTVRVKIPLTLAIIPALIVTCQNQRFAIPQVSLTELVRLEGTNGIEMVHGAPVYRLRGRLLPLVYLRHTLNETETARQSDAVHNDLPDFAAARDKHHQWLNRLQAVLDARSDAAVQKAGSPRECDLGKWIYESGLKQYAAVVEIHTLEQTHRQFHTAVQEVMLAQAKGDNNKAKLALDQVSALSGTILDLLTTVETRTRELQNVNIVVLQAESRQFGLVVDAILDTQEIVVKPLGKQLKGISAYSGVTIMGDGRVALILDIPGLAQRAKVIAEAHQPAPDAAHRAPGHEGFRGEQVLLLAANGAEGRVAIPLSMVARLEEFPRTAIESAGSQEVMQYRGQIIPLVRLSQIIPAISHAEMLAETNSIQVVVYSEGMRTVGLIVDRIIDIVEERMAVESLAPRTGVVGSFVTQQHVTDLLDLPALVRAAMPGLMDATQPDAASP